MHVGELLQQECLERHACKRCSAMDAVCKGTKAHLQDLRKLASVQTEQEGPLRQQVVLQAPPAGLKLRGCRHT